MRLHLIAATAFMVAVTTPSWADDFSFVGTWHSDEEGAGSFHYKENGQFVWTDGDTINTGVWMFDPETDRLAHILNPMRGIDDHAIVTVLNDGATVKMSFDRVYGEPQEEPWVAQYDRVD